MNQTDDSNESGAESVDEETASAIRAIRMSMLQAEAGQGRPMREFIEELAAKHGIILD